MTLRPYQADIALKAANLIASHGIAYLAMETRTGKTITAFEAIRYAGKKSVLFVTKKKAIKSIQTDYQNFNLFFACTVINYESVSKCTGSYDILVIDEAHSLGAFPKPAKRVKDLLVFSRGLPIIYLSATPTPESYSQFYHQLYISSFSPFAQWRNFYKWAHEFVTIKKKYVYNRELNDYSDADLAKIAPYVNPLMITFTQQQAGFTETIQEKVLYCYMNDLQNTMIKSLLKDRIVRGQSGRIVLGDTAVKLQSKVHQICSGTVKDEDGNGIIVSRNKAFYVHEYFSGSKIAVFYKFQAECDMLKQVFNNWTESPEEFQQSADKTFIGQFQSAREGIRLDTADAIVFLNIDFAYLSYAQAKDRIVSKERTKQAVLYWIFSIGGIEERIYKVVTKKKDYTTSIFKKDYNVRGSVSGKSHSAA